MSLVDPLAGEMYTVIPRAVSSSEAASLGGKKALTPIIAGSVCGGLMLLVWIIGFGIYFRKRYNRKQRNRLIAAGKAVPREKDLQTLKEKVIIPPDPAVLLGQRKPGEILFPERSQSKDGHHRLPWSHHGSNVGSKVNLMPPEQSSDRAEGHPLSTTKTKDDRVVDEMSVPSNV